MCITRYMRTVRGICLVGFPFPRYACISWCLQQPRISGKHKAQFVACCIFNGTHASYPGLGRRCLLVVVQQRSDLGLKLLHFCCPACVAFALQSTCRWWRAQKVRNPAVSNIIKQCIDLGLKLLHFCCLARVALTLQSTCRWCGIQM